MYKTLKQLIPAGGYKLSDMLNKIKKLYLLGDITEDQLDELISLAGGNVSTYAERPAYDQMLNELVARLETIEKRVDILEKGGEITPDVPDVNYPDWKPWDGISKDYSYGAIVAHSGKLWISTFAGQNVWEPGATGTGALWAEYTREV